MPTVDRGITINDDFIVFVVMKLSSAYSAIIWKILKIW